MLAKICWAALAALHAVPAAALVNPALIERLYGATAGSNVFLLLQHRAALFLVICVVCLWAYARPDVRQLAAVAAGMSMLSFLALYWAGGSPAALRTIAVGDLIGLPFLLLAGWQAWRPA